MHIELEIPYPVSVNAYYRSLGNRSILSKRGREYKKHAKSLEHLRGTFSKDQRLKVTLNLYPPTRRVTDLDNLSKSALDLLEDAGIFVNDSQIDQLVLKRREVTKGGKAVVNIRVMKELERNE
jgi:crossover junction endodeoxyribonuclease RusA